MAGNVHATTVPALKCWVETVGGLLCREQGRKKLISRLAFTQQISLDALVRKSAIYRMSWE
uniref:Transposase n=1 Tax=Tolypothrix bouteillei VB521301 TaxID=1479485 RepID=A0A0C1QV59_9CYAN